MIVADEKFYGRLKARKLTQRQQWCFDTLLSQVKIASFAEVDFENYPMIFFEIGFGSGEHIAQMALNNQNALYVGCEPFINGVASLLTKIDDLQIKNIRIYQGDARCIIKEIPSESLDGVFLLFPDPWAKRRHIKRRFLQESTITNIYAKLKSGGFWRIATDHKDYASWVLKLFNNEKFRCLFDGQFFDRETRQEEQVWPKTRYEQKATGEILYASFVKNAHICSSEHMSAKASSISSSNSSR